MSRLTLFLLLASVGSALYVVHTQYESRRLYVELEKAFLQSRKLEADKESLQVEKRSQATPLRVEKLARERLQMRTVTPAITHYVAQSTSASSAATSVEAKAVSDGPPQARPAPFSNTGGSVPPKAREATSVGAAAAPGRPKQGTAPSGGSAVREATSVGAISP